MRLWGITSKNVMTFIKCVRVLPSVLKCILSIMLETNSNVAVTTWPKTAIVHWPNESLSLMVPFSTDSHKTASVMSAKKRQNRLTWISMVSILKQHFVIATNEIDAVVTVNYKAPNKICSRIKNTTFDRKPLDYRALTWTINFSLWQPH